MEPLFGLPRNIFYDLTLDDEQVLFVEAIKDLRKTIVFCNGGVGKVWQLKNG